MTTLKDTARLVLLRAKEKQEAGKVPTFLGVKGMLALMYESITRYYDTESDDYILDLAVAALFCMHEVMPEIPQEEEQQPEDEVERPSVETSDPRWTPIKPGDHMPEGGAP